MFSSLFLRFERHDDLNKECDLVLTTEEKGNKKIHELSEVAISDDESFPSIISCLSPVMTYRSAVTQRGAVVSSARQSAAGSGW